MSLYYQDEHVTLFHGDCLAEHQEWLTADVLVTDPPYGMSYSGFGGRKGEPSRARGKHNIAGDSTTEARDKALAAWGDGPAVVFGKWTQPRPPATKQRLIWDKRPCGFLGDVGSPWASTEEEVYILGTWPAVAPGGRRREGGVPAREGNILGFPTLNSMSAERPEHPTPKPVPLMEHLVGKCPPGVVADPFAGSGATLIAARNLGRKSIGVELEEKYCEIIATRLDQQVIDFEALM